jgi:hypothetical protein
MECPEWRATACRRDPGNGDKGEIEKGRFQKVEKMDFLSSGTLNAVRLRGKNRWKPKSAVCRAVWNSLIPQVALPSIR